MKFKYGDKVRLLNNDFFSDTTFTVVSYVYTYSNLDSKTLNSTGETQYGLIDDTLQRPLDYIKESEMEKVSRKPRTTHWRRGPFP
jgi:hypothetical protein